MKILIHGCGSCFMHHEKTFEFILSGRAQKRNPLLNLSHQRQDSYTNFFLISFFLQAQFGA